MRKATWYFADGREKTSGATGDLFALTQAGHRLAERKGTTLIGWKFSHKLSDFMRDEERLVRYPYP